jgi:kinesin family protein 2/24
MVAEKKLGDGVPNQQELIEKYDLNSDWLCQDHEKMIEKILEEEEKIIKTHRVHIDKQVSGVKDEMGLLNDVDKPGSDVETYIVRLDEVLRNKVKAIEALRG